MITIDDAFLAPSHGTREHVYRFWQDHPPARIEFSRRVVERVWSLCAARGVAFELAIARIANETGATSGDILRFLVSQIYKDRGNIGGLGVTDGEDDMLTFDVPEDAADAYMAHLFTYILPPGYNVLGVTKDKDPRWVKTPAAWRGQAKTIDDLRGRWFTNPNGSIETAQRGNQIFPNLPNQGGTPVPTKPRGHVPRPPMMERFDAGDNHNIGTGRSPDSDRFGFIVGTADHTSQGSFRGNLSVYLDPTWGGLTDYQIGGPWDDVYDGVIMIFIDPTSRIIPWANGGVGDATAPYGDAPRFLQKFGVGGVNAFLRSIETTDGGIPDRTKGGRQIESLCFLHAYIHAEEAAQTSETFDWNMHHREFGGAHQQCPGMWIIQDVDDIQSRTKEIMDYFQFGKKLSTPLLVTYPPGWDGPMVPLPNVTPTPPKPPTPLYARPILPKELIADMKAGEPHDHVINGLTYRATKQAYRATRRTRRLQQPIEVAKKPVIVGPSIEAGTGLSAWWETGKSIITAHGTSLYKPAFRAINPTAKGPIPTAEKPVKDRK